MSSSIQTHYLNTSKKDADVGSNESEYLLIETPKNVQTLAAEGVSTLFDRFRYKIHTFQFLRRLPDGKSDTTVRLYNDPKKALKESLELNLKGFDVFFMVNEGTGVIPAGKRIPRCKEAVKLLTSCFIDTDNCPKERIDNYLLEVGIPAHFIVESSPGRFHYYFFLKPLPPSTDSGAIAQWEAIQKILARLGDHTLPNTRSLGTDNTMHDYSKVLRVPGFTHVTKRFTSKIVASRDIPIYDLETLFLMTNAQAMIDQEIKAPQSHVPDISLDGPIIQAGERFQALQALAMSLANKDMEDQEKWGIFHNFVLKGIDNTDNAYCTPQGALTDKSKDLLSSALEKKQKENVQKIEFLSTSLEHKNDPAPSPWELPDSFYLAAPNGFGDVVRQVMEYSLYPCASLAFGTFLTGLSILKARTHLTPYGASPALYTLNVAISGFGKNDPMTLLQNLFVHLGYKKLIENEIRSDRTIYSLLKDNDGKGLCILDEIAPLLKIIQDDKATSHHANISKALLFLYSSGAMKGVSFGRVSSSATKRGEQAIIVDNPMLAVLGFTVPQEFSKLFNSVSIVKGLFQRFIPIVTKLALVPKSLTADKQAIVRSDLFTPLALGEAQEIGEDGEQAPPLQTVPVVKMPFTTQAKAHFEEIDQEYRRKMYEAAKDPETEAISGVYSRIAEQIERIATVLAQDAIDLTTLTYAAEFMNSRHSAVMATIQDTVMVRADRSASMEKEKIVLAAITRISQQRGISSVSLSEIFQRVRRQMSKKDLEICIQEADLSGKISIGKGNSGAGKRVQLGNVIESD